MGYFGSWVLPGTNMKFNYARKISSLSQAQRASFYERLANNLTIAVRWICGHEDWADADKVGKLSRLNEIQHGVTSQVIGARRGVDNWSEADFARSIDFHVGEDEELLALVERVIERTYTRVSAIRE